VLELCRPGAEDRVVDLGCGWGTFTFALAPCCREVVGVDYSRESILLCSRLLEKKKPANVRFLCADAQHTGLEPDGYDAVIAADLAEHLYPDVFDNVVDECRRILKPNGRLAIWTPHRGHLIEVLKNRDILLKHDPSHVDYKSMARLNDCLARRGFAVEKAYYAESHLPLVRWVEKALLRHVPLLRRRIAVLARKKG
jgi:cyclopropane fatty-acyl-phospholipid synthase-like methyltransferase